MKAWVIDIDEYEGTQEIVFADTRGGALAVAVDITGGEFVEQSARRAPQFDKYASLGYVPPLTLLATGWYLHCFHCGCRLEAYDADEAVADGGDIYCGPCCEKDQWAFWGQRAGNKFRAKEVALERWPGIELFDVSGVTIEPKTRRMLGSVRFRFPGGEGLVSWTRGSEDVYVERRDLDAWQRFSGELRSAR